MSNILFYKVVDSVVGIERCLVSQFQRFDHVQRPLLVFLEMCGSDVLVVCLPARVCFKDGYLAGILLFADGIHGQHARFGTQGDFAHLGHIFYVFINELRLDFDFRQAHDAVGSHFFLGAHTRLRFPLCPVARQQSEQEQCG